MTGNWTFVIAAYSVTWAVIIAYFVRLQRGLQRARSDYDAAIAAAKTEAR